LNRPIREQRSCSNVQYVNMPTGHRSLRSRQPNEQHVPIELVTNGSRPDLANNHACTVCEQRRSRRLGLALYIFRLDIKYTTSTQRVSNENTGLFISSTLSSCDVTLYLPTPDYRSLIDVSMGSQWLPHLSHDSVTESRLATHATHDTLHW